MIRMRTAFGFSDLVNGQDYDIGIFGEELDQRTRHSIELIQRNCKEKWRAKYYQEDLTIRLGDDQLQCEELPSLFSRLKSKKICIDSTSLDVPELALIMKALNANEFASIDILYIEPESYTADISYSPSNSEFELSEKFLGFESAGVPTITRPIPEEILGPSIFFAGFESERLANAFETYEFNDKFVTILFGVPSFKPGWETISFKNNLRTLRENSITGRIDYCSANCPNGALRKIRKIISVDPNHREIYLIPLGTKPNSLAAILFSLEHETSTLIYDHPQKKPGRSSGVGLRNLYRVNF